MALYSWFTKNTTKLNKKSIRVNNNLLKASESVKYIENYTMWPTAKIKQGIEVTLPTENKLAKKSNKQKPTVRDKNISLDVALTVNK
ncbi:MAG: hypothetical protein HRT51_09850 [Colwellia sp.]|nr:hypothetical protein [Colwellia sp.]